MLARLKQISDCLSVIVNLYKVKATLKAKGWTHETAADRVGVHRVYLTTVLNGHRNSRRLLAAIASLPIAPTKPARKSQKGIK